MVRKNTKKDLKFIPESNDVLNLHEVLKNSYSKNKKQNMNGFIIDNDLSNHNQQIYYNPNNKKLLMSGTGTHNLSDVWTDVALAFGKLKDTNRYKEAKSTLENAKKKYGVDNAIITGHSLFGTIGGYIGNPQKDQIYTLDKGATIGQKVRKGEKAFRTEGDAVSLLNANAKHMTTIGKPTAVISPTTPSLIGMVKNVLDSHNVDAIKNSGITLV